jgi:hypothetical protein
MVTFVSLQKVEIMLEAMNESKSMEIPVSVCRSGMYLKYVLRSDVPNRLVCFERCVSLPSQELYQSCNSVAERKTETRPVGDSGVK